MRYYLGEEPLLPNVHTYDLRDPEQREHVLPRLDRMVVKPVDGSGGYGIVVGSKATDAELATAAATIQADPRGWIAQPIVILSTSPTVVEGGRLAPRHPSVRCASRLLCGIASSSSAEHCLPGCRWSCR